VVRGFDQASVAPERIPCLDPSRDAWATQTGAEPRYMGNADQSRETRNGVYPQRSHAAMRRNQDTPNPSLEFVSWRLTE
jgi:hypothetical protein